MSGESQQGSIDQDPQMQADIDRMAAEGEAADAAAAAAGNVPVPQGWNHCNFHRIQNAMMQYMMRMMMDAMRASFRQAAPGMPNAGTTAPVAFSPQGSSHWRQDTHMANVRLDERAFRRLKKSTNKRGEWKEWRTQLLTAIRECAKGFADSLVVYEKAEDPFKDDMLTPAQQQLSATLQARLISLTAKEAFSIVNATEGQGVEALRLLGKRFDPQTDARFALLLISVVSFKIGKGQDVQSELIRGKTTFLSLERDHAEKLSPKSGEPCCSTSYPRRCSPVSWSTWTV